MIEIYISNVKDLAYNEEALGILRESSLISGIELPDTGRVIERIKDAGFKFSSHGPGMNILLNLANLNYMEVFESDIGERILEVIRNSDASTVGFHCGFSAEQVYKMKSFPNVPKFGTLITDEGILLERIVNNIVSLEKKINEPLTKRDQKQIVIENLEYMRDKRPIPWSLQSDEVTKRKEEIEGMVSRYGANSSCLYITEPFFIKNVLDKSSLRNIKPIGFLLDIGHAFVSADTKVYNNELEGTIENYFDDMLNMSNNRTYQLHINVPKGNKEEGFYDGHLPFKEGEWLSDYVMKLTELVVGRSPEILVLTLEMGQYKDNAVEHAKLMINQAEYVVKRLGL